MKRTILFLLFFLPVILKGQETRKVNNGEKNEQFYVLKSDKRTRHGEYQKFSLKNKLLVKGNYRFGVRDSIWNFYQFNGQIISKYDFTKNEPVYFNYNNDDKNKEFVVIIGNKRFITKLSRPPIFLGGSELMFTEIASNLRYPKQARESKKNGRVNVIFTINKFGKAVNHHVETPLGYGLDEEAIRAVKLLSDYWLPGLLDNQAVDVEMFYPFNFELN